jgi:hypothetical protein
LEINPYREPPALAALRFALEPAAWIAIYFAWGFVPLVLAIAAVSVFSVPGDKHMVVIKTPGKVRILIELALAVAGVAAAHQAWRIPPASVLLLAFAVLFAASRRRLRWLWQH